MYLYRCCFTKSILFLHEMGIICFLLSFECQPATAFKGAYESLGISTSGGKSVSMQKIWHLIQVWLYKSS